MTRPAPGTFGFVIARSRLLHHRRDVARFTCARCPAECEVKPTWPLNPEAAASAAARFGWKADAYHSSANRCPACLAKRSPGDSPKPKETVPMEPKKPSAAVPATAQLPREPSQAERLKIRAILDKHFDDAAGCWLEGYSDQKAGEERAQMDQLTRDLRALAEREEALRKKLDNLLKARAA